MLITAIETIRSVARHAAEDPQPPAAAADRPLASFPARLWRLLARLLDAEMPEGQLLRILVRTLRALLPLLVQEPPPSDPPADPPSDPPADPPESPLKTLARIDLLRQERAARARGRRAGELSTCAPPDRPPVANRAAAAGNAGQVWHELVDLASEAVEACVAAGDDRGIGRCVELLDVLAETFDGDRPEAA